ncbi:MAG: acyltransferase family protein, partial [Variibacter sp.]
MLERAGAYWAKPQIKKTVYRNDIDGLRALAVLSVIGFHAFPGWVPGGFVGVDIFFVISGYLISGHIFNSLEAGNFSIVTFYGKRVRRIFPAMILVLAACLIFGWLALLPDEFLQLGKHTAAGSGFVANLVFWSEAGYFNNTAATKPMLHLWSLGVEEQFYIIWPILAWAAWTFRWKLLPTMILLAGFSFALNTTYYISN